MLKRWRRRTDACKVSESKINTSPSGEPLEGEISVTVETPTAGSAPGGPLMAGVGF